MLCQLRNAAAGHGNMTAAAAGISAECDVLHHAPAVVAPAVAAPAVAAPGVAVTS